MRPAGRGAHAGGQRELLRTHHVEQAGWWRPGPATGGPGAGPTPVGRAPRWPPASRGAAAARPYRPATRHAGSTAFSAPGEVARRWAVRWSVRSSPRGLNSFKPDRMRGHHADGLLLAFVVPDVDAEHDRLAAGAPVLTPPETEPWGERYLQVMDPSGVVLQLVTWVEAPTG
ncbi:VOC family protein [Aquipuribacter sp. MA13-6]|uniref:VOC family protein n=1 Tax=unclassified Aquipuribacter TaxID=2635084 RepID=UPI003EECF555